MREIVFVIGGCRSGKSRHALELAEKIPGNKKIFIATCVPYDDEMHQRVVRHQEERSNDWETMEVPVRLPEAINDHSQDGSVILVDCLTLWINNLLMEINDPDKIQDHIQRLSLSLKAAQGRVIIVSNEVGAGIVPENKLARLFRDSAGFANQSVAACADQVIWTVAGIPVPIKSNPKTA
ncbi:MAG: bifunctional adenosylcobinamide kinase/adenosylcobinamide-phosphate guanylyltransferase [Desulfobacterales bacterium]|nr:bifunctional adenosylcobinamide kinase/adenosylcobinamide-phosphate guanylyltransferase [Desulfobacterales bacterium]